MNDCRTANPTAIACTASSLTPAARPAAQVALRMAQYKRAARRHPRAAMGALAHWLRSLDQAPAAPALHGSSATPTCAAPQAPAAVNQQ